MAGAASPALWGCSVRCIASFGPRKQACCGPKAGQSWAKGGPKAGRKRAESGPIGSGDPASGGAGFDAAAGRHERTGSLPANDPVASCRCGGCLQFGKSGRAVRGEPFRIGGHRWPSAARCPAAARHWARSCTTSRRIEKTQRATRSEAEPPRGRKADRKKAARVKKSKRAT